MPKGTMQLITMVGRLGIDPVHIHRPQGVGYCQFRLAANANVRKDTGDWVAHTDWWDVVCEAPLNTVAEEMLRKGDLVGVIGVLKKTYKGDVTILARDLQVFGSCLICQGQCPKCSGKGVPNDPNVRLQVPEMQ